MGSIQFNKIAVLALLVSSGAYATDFHGTVVADLSPTWSNQMSTQLDQNQSILNDSRPKAEEQINLINAKQGLEMTQQYQDLTRDYDMRRDYGIVDMREEKAYEDSISNFSHDIYQKIYQNQLSQQRQTLLQSLEGVVNGSPALTAAKKPAMVAGAIAAAATGNPIPVTIFKDTKVTTMTNVQANTGQVKLESPVIGSSFDYNGTMPLQPTPWQPFERYKLSLSRPLPWSLSSAVSYGSTSTSVTASLTRPIMANLSAELDQTDPLDPGVATVIPPQTSLKLFYGIKF